MEAASAPGFADPAMMHEQMMAMQQQILAMQQAAQQGGGVEGMGPVVLPGMEMQGYPAQEGMAAAPGCSGPSTGGRPTVSFAPKMKEMEAAAGKLAPTMPEELRPIAEAGVRRDARHIFFPPLNRFFALLL